MAKNLQIALIVLLVFIGLFLLNKSSQSKHKSSTEAIFFNDPEDIFKFLIYVFLSQGIAGIVCQDKHPIHQT